MSFPHRSTAPRETGPASPDLSAVLPLALWVLLAEVWFRGPLIGARLPLWTSAVLGLALLVAVGARAGRALATTERGAWGAFAAVAALATLVRLPALAAPASLLSSDSAVAGIIAQELRAGHLPAPIYAPGFPYEGTLKPHLTAALGLLTGLGTPFLYTLSSHLFYLLWIFAVMALARRAAGPGAALGAGLFMALSPRFLMAFSLNNVGQYPEVNALGSLGLALLAAGGSLLAPGFVLGLALWQQLLGVYFVLVAGLAVVLTPSLRRIRPIGLGLAGFAAGSYPMWIWNAANGWATLDFFRRGGKEPWERLTGLPERIERTVTLSFPKLLGLTDAGAPPVLAAVLGLALPLVVLAMAWASRTQMREQRARSAVFLVTLLLGVVLSVFTVSKFSHRGAQRPRYLLPLYTALSVAVGWGLAGLGRRSRPAAVAAGAALLSLNGLGLVPWLRGRAPAEARDDAIVEGLARLGVRTGYTGFWVAAKYTFLAEGRFVLSGELGPDVSWVHAAHAQQVRTLGPDAYVLQGSDLASRFAGRLDVLGVRYERSELPPLTVFHNLSRVVRLEEVDGYDGTGHPGPAVADEG